MIFKPATLEGVVLIEPKIFEDSRGAFFEEYQASRFAENGIADCFVQDNHSISAKGVLRGLHYQLEPCAQSKLVHVVRGSVFDVVVDMRRHSKTFGRFVTNILSAENRKMLYIPKGFAHGFLALEEASEFIYKVSSVYSPGHERGLLWSDPALKIPWPNVGRAPILSDKDLKHPLLENAPVF